MITDMPIPKFPAGDVKPIRESLGMTQAELADQIGVARTLVTHWEKGLREPTGPAAILLSQLKARSVLEKTA